jgi:hypothetical protein
MAAVTESSLAGTFVIKMTRRVGIPLFKTTTKPGHLTTLVGEAGRRQDF